jgi:peroxiredoxin
LRSFQQRLPDFNARGIRVVAISVDTPEVNRRHCQKLGFTYTFLSDSKAEVIRRYDLLHTGGGAKGSDVARPAEFLIDSSGAIRWVNLTESLAVRARPNQVLKAFDELKQGSPAGAEIQPSGLLASASASMGR